jgi:putative inorganic carbon (HCO3(-)) transporter
MQKTEKEPMLIRIIKYAVYITAFVPLVIFSQYISPFHFGKVIILRPLIEIIAVFYLILVLSNRNYLPPFKNKIFLAATVFTALFGILTIFSTNPYLSFWGSFERMGGWWTFFHLWAYFTILVSVFKRREDWTRLFEVVIFVGVISAFYGFLQRTNLSFILGSGGRTRIFGTIGNPALFAGYEILNSFLAFLLAISSWTASKHKKYFYFAALVGLTAILMTAVRGSLLAVAVGALVFAFLYAVKLKSLWAKRILWSLLIAGVLFIAFAFSFKNSGLVRSSGYLSRITDFSFKTFTVQTRFWAWSAGLHGWANGSPENSISGIKTSLLGWGPENFNVPFSINFNPNFFTGNGAETLFDRAHNMFVEILVTMGLLAFIAYISIFVFAFYLIWKYTFKQQKIDKTLGIGLISLLVGYIIHNCFIFDTSANFLVFFTILAFIAALTSSAAETQESQIMNEHKVGAGLQSLMLILFVGVGILIYNTSILSARANYASTRGIVAGWNKDVNGAIQKFRESVSYDVPGKYDNRHKYAQYILDTFNGAKIGDSEKMVILDAINEVQKNVNENKLDYLPYLYESRLYIILGKSDPGSPYNDKALENSMTALKISPTFVRTYYEVAQAYLNKQDYATALKYFNQAIELNPKVGLSYWYAASVYLGTKDTKTGLAYVNNARKYGYSFSESDLNKLVNVYFGINDFNDVVWAFRSLIGINPNNAQYHASLAAAYAKLGKIDEAVSEARSAVKLDPTFQKEAETFVKSLGRQL